MNIRETCAVYIRKSTDDDENQKYTLDSQRRITSNLVLENDLKIITNGGEPYIEAISAKDPWKREKYSKLITELRLGKVDHLVVSYADRITRNRHEANEFMEIMEKGFIRSVIAQDGTFRSNKSAEVDALEEIFQQAQKENRYRSRRTKEGMEQGFIDGKTMGRFPFGYAKHHYIGDDGNLIKDIKVVESQARLVIMAFNMRKDGCEYQEIVNAFAEEGVKTSTGSVYKILANSFYYGDMRSSVYKNLFSTIQTPWYRQLITKELFNAAWKDKTNYKPKMEGKDYFLNGIIFGEDGGKAIPTATNGYTYYKQAKKTPYSYHISQKIFLSEITRKIDDFHIPEQYIETVKMYMEGKLKINFWQMKTESKWIKISIDDKEGKRKTVKRKFMEDIITKEEYEEYVQDVDKEIAILRARLEATEQGIKNLQDQISSITIILRDVAKAYRKAEWWERTKILKLLGIRIIVKPTGTFTIEGNKHFLKDPLTS